MVTICCYQHSLFVPWECFNGLGFEAKDCNGLSLHTIIHYSFIHTHIHKFKPKTVCELLIICDNQGGEIIIIFIHLYGMVFFVTTSLLYRETLLNMQNNSSMLYRTDVITKRIVFLIDICQNQFFLWFLNFILIY